MNVLRNKIFDKLRKRIQENQYLYKMNKYVIHPGNNGRLLLKPLLDQRGNWIEQETQDLKAAFI